MKLFSDLKVYLSALMVKWILEKLCKFLLMKEIFEGQDYICKSRKHQYYFQTIHSIKMTISPTEKEQILLEETSNILSGQ